MASNDPNDPYRFVDNPEFFNNPTVRENTRNAQNITEGGNKTLDLNFVDYSSLVAPFVDYQKAFDFAERVGNENRDTYYNNLTSNRSKQAALGLVDTDLEGILRGLNQLVPRARSEGNQDTETNIARAGRIDQYNFSRIPQFNEFNRGQVQENNAFNRSEREASIQASGLNYRGRITKTLDQLAQQSEGRMSDGLLDTLITRTNRDRGADIASASGVGSFSGSGRNIQDNLDVNQRIGLALDAQKTLPGVLGQAQGILQPPEQQLQTLTNVPTNVPLNVSNIQDRVPIQSNISAGAAQQQIGTQATEYEIIPATTALSSKLNTDQFNETAQYERDVKVLDSTQGQLTAQDSENLRGVLQDKADENRDLGLAAYQQGLQAQERAANFQAGAGIVGSLLGSSVGQAGLAYVGNGILSALGLGGESSSLGTGNSTDLSAGPDGVSPTLDFGQAGSGGGASSGSATEAATGGGATDFGGGSYDLTTGQGAASPNLTYEPPSTVPDYSLPSGGGADTAIEFFAKTTQPLKVQDAQTTLNAAAVATRFPEMSPTQQVAAVGQIGTQVAVDRGIVSADRGGQVQGSVRGLSTLVDPNASDGQRAAGLGTLAANVQGTQFSGSINAPTTINGMDVIGQNSTGDGFVLSDGTEVPRSDLSESAAAISSVNAFNVVTSKAPEDTKIAALTSIGIKEAAARDMVNQVAAGNTVAALAVFNTTRNFSAMNPVEQASAIIQTGNAAYGAISNSVSTAAPINTGASLFGATLPGGVGLGGITAGAYTGYNQFTGTQKVLSGDADKMNYLEQASLFTMSGGLSALPGIKNLTGGGRSKGREARGQWHEGLRQAGVADDDYNVTLADGSKYNIGKDGEKITNADGVERNSWDIDLSSKVAQNAIPDAHLFAISTGLDPTDTTTGQLWHRATAQGVNAATSNASTPEQVRANFKSMMKDVNPAQLTSRIETLRLTNKINDQEYGVYLDRVNSMYGTQFKPQDRQKAQNTLISTLKKEGDKLPDGAKDLLKTLTDQRRLDKNLKRMEERKKKDREALNGR